MDSLKSRIIECFMHLFILSHLQEKYILSQLLDSAWVIVIYGEISLHFSDFSSWIFNCRLNEKAAYVKARLRSCSYKNLGAKYPFGMERSCLYFDHVTGVK